MNGLPAPYGSGALEPPDEPDDQADADYAADMAARADIPALVSAVEAVLVLHKEVTWSESWPTCLVCNDGEGHPLAYPCETVTAIRTALGEGG